MKYYIFGSSREVIKVKAKNATFKTDYINVCKDTFRKYTDEMRYDHMYMIADYGMIGNLGLFKKQKINPVSHEDTIPFFIIMEYHIGDDRNLLIRSDHTEIYHDRGFTQKFDDNFMAAKCFENCYNRQELVRFTIHYQRAVRREGSNISICEYSREIAHTKISMKKFIGIGDNLISGFIIEPPKWDFLPIKEYAGKIDMDLKNIPKTEGRKGNITFIDLKGNTDVQPAMVVGNGK